MTVPADQETSLIYKADKPRLLKLQEELRNGGYQQATGKRPNIPRTLSYAITAGLVVGKLMEALGWYAEITDGEDAAGDIGYIAREALAPARKELEGAQQ